MEASETNRIEGKKSISLADVLGMADQYKALFIISATAYGFFYLFVYATNNGVPVPINDSNFPMVVLALASAASIIFALLFPLIVAPAFITGNEFEVFYAQTKQCYQRTVTFFLFVGWVVVGTFMILILVLMESELSLMLLIISGILIVGGLGCRAFYKRRKDLLPEKERNSFILFLISTQVAFIILTIAYFGLYALLLSNFTITDGWGYFWASIFAISIIVWLFLSSLPNKVLLKNVTKEKVILMLIILAFCIPINLPIVERSLRVFKIGGGYEAVYYIDEELKKCLPMEVLDEKDQGKTKPLKVLMSSGGKKYVKLKEGQQTERIYGLSLGDANEQIVFGVK